MLKYKLKKNTVKEFSFSYLEDYLISLGIDNPESFIKKPRLEDQESFMNLENIEKTVDWLYEGFKSNKKFFLQIDSDTDGITSSAIFYNFFKRIFPEAKIEYRLHDGKEHGVIVDTVPIDADYVILPDAGSVQYDEQEELDKKGYKVIILDHHNINLMGNFKNVVIVNNQTSNNFKNKDLSGAGVVYKTIQAFNYIHQDEFPLIYEDYADLAALGILADMMDTRNLDNNYIIWKGLNNIKNSMFKALLEKQHRGNGIGVSNPTNPNKIDIAWYIAPLINGVIRFGSSEEKEVLFKGFIEDFELGKIIETTYAGKVRIEDIYEYIARTSNLIRERQNREKMKSMDFLFEKIEKDNLQDNQLLIVIVSNNDKVTVPQTITGLVAMELLKKYKKPTLVLRPKINNKGETIYAGSGRGKQNGDFDSLFDFLKDSNLCEYVEGHNMAFGTAIKEENLPKLIEYANKVLNDIVFDVEEIEVDYIFNNSNINRKMLMEFGSAIDIYGNGIPQPKFAFELNVPRGAINFLGAKKETFKFNMGNVEFIKFRSKELIESIKDENIIYKITLIGRSQINEYNGKVTPQIRIDEIEMEELENERLF